MLTVRAKDLARHSGQVSLPGGRVEDGESVEVAALREAHEEIDVDPLTVRIAGTLTPLHIPLSGFLLHPVVGLTGSRPAFSRHDGEVAEILEVPLRLLADPSRIKRQRRESSGVHYDVPVYDIDGHSIWGATAMVLAEFLELV